MRPAQLHTGHRQQQRLLRPQHPLISTVAAAVRSKSSSGLQPSSSSQGSSGSSRLLTSCRTQAPEQVDLQTAEQQRVGEDAAAFDLSKQSLKSWGVFGVLLTGVLGAMYMVGPSHSECQSLAAAGTVHYCWSVTPCCEKGLTPPALPDQKLPSCVCLKSTCHTFVIGLSSTRLHTSSSPCMMRYVLLLLLSMRGSAS